MFDYRKLRGLIREVCGSEAEFASQLHISRASLSLKLNGKSEFWQKEIQSGAAILGITQEKIGQYFFKLKM